MSRRPRERIKSANFYGTISDMVRAGTPGWPSEAEVETAAHILAAFSGNGEFASVELQNMSEARQADLRCACALILRYKSERFADPHLEFLHSALNECERFVGGAGTA